LSKFIFERAGQLAVRSAQLPVTRRRSAAPKKNGPSQIFAACSLLHTKGFQLYRNKRNDAVAARSSNFMFEFDGLSLRKAQAFFAWFQTHENTRTGLPTLPRGVKAYPIRKPPNIGTETPNKKARIPDIETGTPNDKTPIPNIETETPKKEARITDVARPSIMVGFFYSTVPGHYANLDWYDLCRRH
jgi:hypothetical protein